jgi:hypothetical protein
MAKTPVRRTPQDDARPRYTAVLPHPELTRIQEVVGTLLFYSRAINITMMVALGNIASKQTKGTQATAQSITQLLNYALAHHDATVC